jgi:hypothetical protein
MATQRISIMNIGFQNEFFQKGLEFGFEVHKQNKGRRPVPLPPIDLSFCDNLSAHETNIREFCTFKYVTKGQERYNVGELGKYIVYVL